MTDRPNILYILSDQHRYDALGCAGHPVVQTPNLDRLASEGVRLEGMWCQSPLCQPSRASVITARYPHEHEVRTNLEEFDPDWDTMMKALQRSGYVTSSFGKTHYYQRFFAGLLNGERTIDTREQEAHVGSFGFDHVLEEFDRYLYALPRVTTPYLDHLRSQGILEAFRQQILSIWRLTPTHWDGVTSVLDQPNDLTCFLADRVIEWLESHDGRRPFFIQLSFVQPHVPLMADPQWAEFYAGADVPLGPRLEAKAFSEPWDDYLAEQRKHSNSHLLTDEYVARGARQYYGMVSLIDQRIGDILDALRRRGFMDNTWVVYSSDHGEMLGDHNLMGKSNFYRASARVPAIIRPPRTALDPTLQGRVIEDPVELIDLTATVVDVGGAVLEGARGRSLVPALNGEGVGRETVFSEIGTSANPDRFFIAATTGRHRATFEWTSGTPCELFDLEADPDELQNMVDEPAARPLIEDFRERVATHFT